MSLARQRSGRSDLDRRRVSAPEALESRQLLSIGVPAYQSPWIPSDQFVTNPVTRQRELFINSELINPNNPNSPAFSNQGKIVAGTDRAGDKWVITVHGPGQVIVTDTTPNDGALDDDINTIQLINTSAKKTYVTGNVIPSNVVQTKGAIIFNQLLSVSGVKSIVLNGFDLSNQVSPGVTTQTGIFLYGGVGTLSFDAINATIDTSVNPAPFQIMIGTPSTPLKVQPTIILNNITNLVTDSTATTIPEAPITSPTVQFVINGVVRDFDIVSASQGTITAGFQFLFPVVGTTGRTSVQAVAINNLNVRGSAKNFTASRAAIPFSTQASGLAYLHKARFGGNADAVGLDVHGAIGKLSFQRGLGNPAYVFTAKGSNGLLLPETNYGTPPGSTGYPAAGLSGGTIRASKIGKLKVRPANVLVRTAQDPQLVQFNQQGYPTYATSPGYSLTNAVIATSGSIGQVDVTGTQLNSEIKTGFNYSAYLAGLEATRGASQIGRLKQKGDLVNSVGSASFRPANNHYSHKTGVAGPGKITGQVAGNRVDTGGKTGLGNTGAGLFARVLNLIPARRAHK